MGKSHRQEKVGEEIRKIVSDMLLREIKDPRLDRMISVSAVDVSPDLNYANVYVTVLSGSEGFKTEQATGLTGSEKSEIVSYGDSNEVSGQGMNSDGQKEESTDNARSMLEQEVLEGFESASGMIRNEIGRKMRLHRAPELTFRIDRSMEYGSHIDKLLAELNKE